MAKDNSSNKDQAAADVAANDASANDVTSGAPTEGRFEKGTGDAGQAQVQAATDEAEDKGYIGDKADPVPNEAYSLEGGAPTADAVNDDSAPPKNK